MSTDLGFIHKLERGSSEVTLLLLHGTGGDEDSLLSLGRNVAPEANLLSPRGKVLEAGMPRFFRRLAMGVFDIEDLIARTAELARFVGDAAAAYNLDRERVFALGYSNGANIAASLLLLHPETVAGAALLHAMVPLRPDRLAELNGKPVLMTGGQRDQMIPREQTEALRALLEESGASVSLQWQPGGHEVSNKEVEILREWISNTLSGNRRPAAGRPDSPAR